MTRCPARPDNHEQSGVQVAACRLLDTSLPGAFGGVAELSVRRPGAGK